MQLLNSPSSEETAANSDNQPVRNDAEQILSVLQDITKTQIKPNFCVHHPDYQPSELPEEVIARFQGMPSEVQNRYVSLILRSFLYGIFYNGSMRSALALDAPTKGQPLDLDNNTVLGVDLKFYEQLHNSNCGQGYFDPGWLILREETDGSLAVKKGELTLHIERDASGDRRYRHLQDTEKSATVGNTVAILMPKNFVQNGFYMAVSNQGVEDYTHPQQPSQTVRIYFNLTPEGAIAVMSALTQKLNEIGIPFTFKALYNPADYGRYDSGVLYFQKNHYATVRTVLQIVYIQTRKHFQPEIPLFTKFLASGLGLAEEPDQKFSTQESFGMNRCQIVANGLLSAWHQGDDTPEARLNAIFQSFSLLGIDWERAYLNAKSEDIYTPLDLWK
ncbi:T3SS effector HopA1 family protein [Nodularia sp. UHCC 0506]|uniref:T3SS effector HopA1 family protein n=1 Tax=Nodularia sp. UHCC 0506 TaxID=3110243 RepID=UPI002B204922|nr:T3SS effector HopA1 family protein [Nodularia sp. UHCC 0506]MEA5516751.1 T3SS effector HopA1 family protein [Nodularia sp. UHCC 0506]